MPAVFGIVNPSYHFIQRSKETVAATLRRGLEGDYFLISVLFQLGEFWLPIPKDIHASYTLQTSTSDKYENIRE